MRISIIFTSFLLSGLLQAQELIPYRFNSSWGFADENGNLIIPTEYDEVSSFDKQGYARVSINNDWGIINKNGEIIIPIKYKAIFNFSEGLAAACKGGEYHWIQGEIINGAWGFINEKGEEVIPFKYHRVENFYNGNAIVQIIGDNWGNWGVIDKTGKQILPYKYPSYSFDMRPFPGLRWDEKEKGKLLYRPSQHDKVWRQIDIKGNLTGKKIDDIHGEYALFSTPQTDEKNGKYALKSASGKMLTEYLYDKGIYFYNNYNVATIVKDNLFGVIDINGKIVLPPTFVFLDVVGNDKLVVKKNEKYYLTDLKGESKMEGMPHEIKYLGENIFSMKNDNKIEIYSSEGKRLGNEIFDQTSSEFIDGMLKVKTNNLWGFIDTEGNLVIPCKYPYVGDFNNGLAKVDLNSEQYKIPDEGYINKKGIEFFNSEKKVNIIKENGTIQLSNEYGKILKTNVWDVKEIYPNLISYKENNQLFIINEEGKSLINEDLLDFVPSCFQMDPDLNETDICAYAGITNDTIYIYDKFLNSTYILNGPWNKMDLELFQNEQMFIERNKREVLKTAYGSTIGKSFDKIYYVNDRMMVYGKNDSSAIMNLNGELISDYKKQNILALENHYVSYSNTSKSDDKIELFDYSGKKINRYPMNIFNQSYNTIGFYHVKNLKTKKEGYYWKGIFKEALYNEISIWEMSYSPLVIVNENGKIYLFNDNGTLAIADEFESIDANRNNLAIVKRNGKYGLIGILDGKLNYILKCEYDYIPELNSISSAIAVKKEGKYQYINKNGEKSFAEDFDFCTQFNSNTYALAGKNGKTGVIKSDGKWLIQPVYDYLDFYSDYNSSLVFAGRQNGNLVLLDETEKNILPSGIDSVSFDHFDIYEHILAIKDEKKGVLNFKGELIAPVKYLEIQNFSISTDQQTINYFIVKTETGYGLLDSAGKEISLMNYDSPSQDDDYYVAAELNLIPVKRKGKYGALNLEGKEVLPCEYQKIDWYPFDGDNKQIIILKNGKWGLIGKDAKIIIEPLYDKIEMNYEIMDLGQLETPIFSLKQKGKYGLSNLEGQIIYPCIYSEISPEYDCEIQYQLSLSIGKKKGVGDVFGKIILAPEFEKINCGRFEDKVFFMGWKSNKVSVYNGDGSPFNNKQYDGIDWDGYNDLAMVKLGKAWFYLKADGSEVSIDE